MTVALNRRQAALAFGAAWTSLVIPAGAIAQVTPTRTWIPKALTAAQADTLDMVAELIVPATDTPGAREAGVPAFVDRAVAIYCTPEEAAAIRSGLDRIEADARAAGAAAFSGLPKPAQIAQLNRYEAEAQNPQPQPAAVGRGDTETGLSNRQPGEPARGKPFFPILKDLVTVGYFTSELGATRAVRYDPIPGAYHGCVPLKQIGRAWAL